MRELCAGTLIGSGIARRAPLAVAASMARATAGAAPAITTWPGALKLTASTTSPCAASSQAASTSVSSRPENRRHRALPRRHGGLHGLGAKLDQLDRGP